MSVNPYPLCDKDFIPHFPVLERRQPSFATGIVEWIREIDDYGLLYKIMMRACLILAGMVLLASVVFSPLFVLIFKEYMIQTERDRYEKNLKEYTKINENNGRHWFNMGRTLALQNADIEPLNSSTRKKMTQDLVSENEDPNLLSDGDLVHRASLVFEKFLPQYNLKITCSP